MTTTPSKDDPMSGITVPEGGAPVDAAEVDAVVNGLDTDVAVGGEDPAS